MIQEGEESSMCWTHAVCQEMGKVFVPLSYLMQQQINESKSCPHFTDEETKAQNI